MGGPGRAASKEVDPTGGFLRTPIPIVSPHPLGVGGGIEHGEFSFGEDEPPRGVARVGLSRFGNKMIRCRALARGRRHFIHDKDWPRVARTIRSKTASQISKVRHGGGQRLRSNPGVSVLLEFLISIVASTRICLWPAGAP